MKLELVMADPAGNRTALVRTPVAPSLRGEAAKRILADRKLKAEQVGYCCPPVLGSLGRLEMMGGEFCGNAARSFALLLAADRGISTKAAIPVEVSGCSGILAAEADPEKMTAACPLPLPFSIEGLTVPGLGSFPAVRMEGITHVILRGIEAGEDAFRAVRQSAEKRWEWEALGGMFLHRDTILTPVVAVRMTDSTVFESSCASGSAAAAAWLSREDGDGEREYRFAEPGGELAVKVVRQGGRLTELTVGGKVALEPAAWWEC